MINSYDAVVGASGGSAGKGASGGSSSGGTSGTTGEAGGSDAGAGGSVTPLTGLVVVGGTVAGGDDNVLVVLDPTTGDELSSESISGAAVAGIAYDGAFDKNLWFIFTATRYPADRLSAADLQIRRYDDGGNSWSTIDEVTALPPPRPNSFVVLNDRLAYLSTVVEGTTPVDAVTILDTADPLNVAEVAFTQPTLTGEVLGMVGVRGSPGNQMALGGTLAIASGEGCTGTGADRACTALTLLPVFVGNAVSSGVATSRRAFSGQPAFASAVLEQRAFVALPAESPGGNIEILRFNPRDLMFETPLSPTTQEHWVGGLAYADCPKVMAFAAVTTSAAWATSQQGLSASLPLSHLGQGIVYEPFTGTVLTSFNPDNEVFTGAMGAGGQGGEGNEPMLQSFTVDQTGITPMLAERDSTAWQPPGNIAPNIVVTRFPIPFSCPP